MLSIPFPYIATTAGWMTAELGRQPWLIYGLMRTVNGVSPRVSAGKRSGRNFIVAAATGRRLKPAGLGRHLAEWMDIL